MRDASCYTLSERKQSTGYNSTYPKGGFSCSKESFVFNQTLELLRVLLLFYPRFKKNQKPVNLF